MKKKIGNFWATARSETEYRLRQLCGRPSPLKRFVTVLILGSVLAIANLYLVVSSIYNIGKRDAEQEFMKLQHIETLKLQQKQSSDSINIQNQKAYEYE
jgi:hypothetical protein